MGEVSTRQFLDFEKPMLIKAARLHWREPYAKKFKIQYATGGDLYFGHNKAWHDFPHGKISDGRGGAPLLDLGMPHGLFGKSTPVRYVRILMMKSSESSIMDHAFFSNLGSKKSVAEVQETGIAKQCQLRTANYELRNAKKQKEFVFLHFEVRSSEMNPSALERQNAQKPTLRRT